MAATLAIRAQLAGDTKMVVLNDAAALYLRLGDALASSTAADSSGNGHPGTVVGGVTFGQATGLPDGDTAALLNGTSGYISVPHAASITPTGDFSVECWVKTSSAGYVPMVEKYGGSGGPFQGFLFDVGSQLAGKPSLWTGQAWVNATVRVDNGQWHHLVAVLSGGVVLLYVDGALNTSATPSGAPNLGDAHALEIGRRYDVLDFAAATIDEVALYLYALSATQVLNHYLSGLWTDLTGDVTAASIRVARGFQSNEVDDLVAAPPTVDFALDNSAHNSASTLSYYSLDAASKRPGWQEGIRVQCRVTANGSTRTRFDGWLETATATTGLYEEQTVACQAIGWTGHAATSPAIGIVAQIGQRADQILPRLIALVPFQPPATAIATGLDTFPIALDDLDPATAMVTDAIDSIMRSGLDRLYEKADGTLVFETRWTREMSTTNVLTLSDVPAGGTPGLALTQLPAERRRDAIRNRFQVTVHPRRLDAAAVVLYALQISTGTAAIPPGTTLTFVGGFVDPNQQGQRIGGFNTLISDGGSGSIVGTSGSLPVADFAFGSAAGGTDLSASCTVTVSYDIGQATFTVTNNAAVPAIPSKLQCRGQGIYNYQTVTATEIDATSRRTVGQNAVSIDCPYQSDPYFAQAAALFGLNLHSTALTQLDQGVQAEVHAGDEVSMDTLLQREISDPIGIAETVSGLTAGNYWINAVVEEYDERTNAVFTFMLTPRDPNTYFALDVSTLDGPDVLAAI